VLKQLIADGQLPEGKIQMAYAFLADCKPGKSIKPGKGPLHQVSLLITKNTFQGFCGFVGLPMGHPYPFIAD
jgi:hypothetical protein